MVLLTLQRDGRLKPFEHIARRFVALLIDRNAGRLVQHPHADALALDDAVEDYVGRSLASRAPPLHDKRG
jgi:hypothetical protein